MHDIIMKFKTKGEFLLIGMLLLFFTTDALNVILIGLTDGQVGYTSSFTKLSSVSKGLFLIVYCIYALKYRIRSLLVIICLIVFFLINASVIYSSDGFDFYFTWLIHVAKLALPFVLFDLISKLSVNKESKVFRLYVVLILVQSITVIIAFLLKIDLFLTYDHHRFGYSGLLCAQNEASFYYLLAIVFLLMRWIVTAKKSNLYIILLVLCASVLLGSKAVFIFFISLIIFVVLVQHRYNRIGLGLFLFSIGCVISWGLYLSGYFDFYISYWQKANWLTMITSFRNLLVQERLPAVFENWSWYNYLFGGVNPATSFVEMDVIDLFTFGGIVGSLLYFYFLFKTLFKFSRKNYLGWFLVSQYFLIGGLAGHVFASGINAIYLALTCYYLQEGEKNLELIKGYDI